MSGEPPVTEPGPQPGVEATIAPAPDPAAGTPAETPAEKPAAKKPAAEVEIEMDVKSNDKINRINQYKVTDFPDKSELAELMKLGRDHSSGGKVAALAVNCDSIPDDVIAGKRKGYEDVASWMQEEGKGRMAFPFYGGREKLFEILHTDMNKGIQPARERNTLAEELAWRSTPIQHIHSKNTAQYGCNALERKPPPTYCELIMIGLEDLVMRLLMASACVQLILGLVFHNCGHGTEEALLEPAAILFSVFLVVNVGACTDYYKNLEMERQIAQMKSDDQVKVIRNGEPTEIEPEEIVVGDIVEIGIGQVLVADGIWIDGTNFKMGEAALTGESDAQVKNKDKPFMYAGTDVIEGEGKMLVLSVGLLTTAGAIEAKVMDINVEQLMGEAMKAESQEDDINEKNDASCWNEWCGAEEQEEQKSESPLADKLEDMVVKISTLGLVIAAFASSVMLLCYFVLKFGFGKVADDEDGTAAFWAAENSTVKEAGWDNSEDPMFIVTAFVTFVTVLVVAIPEGLPLAVTLALAFSVKEMQAEKNLVKNMVKCETMGSATAICSDKTGTLTKNVMTAVEFYCAGVTVKAQVPDDDGPKGAQKDKTCGEEFAAHPGLPVEIKDLVASCGAIPTEDGSVILSPGDPDRTKKKDENQKEMDEDQFGSNDELVGNKTDCAVLKFCGDYIKANESNSTIKNRDGDKSGKYRPYEWIRADPALVGVKPNGPTGTEQTNNLPRKDEDGYDEAAWAALASAFDQYPPLSEKEALGVGRVSGGKAPPGFGFSSQRKRISWIVPHGDKYRLFLKGASEVVLSRCHKVQNKTGVGEMTKGDVTEATAAITAFANNGYRTIAMAYRDLEVHELGMMKRDVIFVAPGDDLETVKSENITFSDDYSVVPEFAGKTVPVVYPFGMTEGKTFKDYTTVAGHVGTKKGVPEPILESSLTFLGIVAIQDPLRDGVKKAIQQCNTAGVDVRMVTGDNLRTAVSIATNAGILGEHHFNHVFEVGKIDGLDLMDPDTKKAWKGKEQNFAGSFDLTHANWRKYVELVKAHEPMLEIEAKMKADPNIDGGQVGQFKKAVAQCRGIVVKKGDETTFDSKISDCANMAELFDMLTATCETESDQVNSTAYVSTDPLACIRPNVAMEGTTFEEKVVCYYNLPDVKKRERVENMPDGPEKEEAKKSMPDEPYSQFGKGKAPTTNWYCGRSEGADFKQLEAFKNDFANHKQKQYTTVTARGPNKDGEIVPIAWSEDGEMERPTFNLEVMDEIWPRLRVMARCQPEHKECLVSGMMESVLHARGDKMKKLEQENIHIAPEGQIVAVTGDGTNDAPSLKKAHVGFAMGIAGTKVSKNACDIVLMDDNFASTVVAIKWGRNVYDSVVKFLQFQLTVNIVAIIVASIGACVYQSSPLGAIQMLWVNLIMDSLGSLALATEKPTEALLLRHAYGKSQDLISTPMWFNMLGQSVYQLAVVLLTMFYGEYLFFDSASHDKAQIKSTNSFGNVTSYTDSDEYLKIGRVAGCDYTEHYTCLFNVFVMMTLFNQVAARKLNNEYNIFDGICANPYFLIIIGIEGVMQLGFVQVLGKGVGCKPITAMQWAKCIAFGLGCWIWQMPLNALANYCKPYLLEGEKQAYKDQLNDGASADALDTLVSAPGVGQAVKAVSLTKRVQSSSNLGLTSNKSTGVARPDGK